MHRLGSYPNSHVLFHVLVTEVVFNAGAADNAVFNPAPDLTQPDFATIWAQLLDGGGVMIGVSVLPDHLQERTVRATANL